MCIRDRSTIASQNFVKTYRPCLISSNLYLSPLRKHEFDESSQLPLQIKASKNDGRFSSFFDGSSSNFGLVEAKYEEDFRGGNSPHLWTGSVQIIEEFLRGGATPVKYAQCWVISALMTSRE